MIPYKLVASLMVVLPSLAMAEQPITADSMGLSKSSVFEVPTQKVYVNKAEFPGQNKVLPRAYLNAPPQVPHDVSDFLPLSADSNMCISCHDQPDQWGVTRESDEATPIPKSHYTDLRNKPDKVTDQLIGARYNCNQCHVTQVDAAPLVKNTFSGTAE